MSATGAPLRIRFLHKRPYSLMYRHAAPLGGNRISRMVVGVALGMFCGYGVAFFVSIQALGGVQWTESYVRGQTEIAGTLIAAGALFGGMGMAGSMWVWCFAILAVVSVQFLGFFLALEAL